MLSFEQFKTLINNIIKLYKNGCSLQGMHVFKVPLLSCIEKVIPVLLSETYGIVVSNLIMNYIKDESEYSLEEIYSVIDDHCKLVTQDSAIALWKLNEMFPNDNMFKTFISITSHE